MTTAQGAARSVRRALEEEGGPITPLDVERLLYHALCGFTRGFVVTASRARCPWCWRADKAYNRVFPLRIEVQRLGAAQEVLQRVVRWHHAEVRGAPACEAMYLWELALDTGLFDGRQEAEEDT